MDLEEQERQFIEKYLYVEFIDPQLEKERQLICQSICDKYLTDLYNRYNIVANEEHVGIEQQLFTQWAFDLDEIL